MEKRRTLRIVTRCARIFRGVGVGGGESESEGTGWYDGGLILPLVRCSVTVSGLRIWSLQPSFSRRLPPMTSSLPPCT